MSVEFRRLWKRKDEIKMLAKDLADKNYSLFICLHGCDPKTILPLMVESKKQKKINVVYTDSLCWGWCYKYTDYRFILYKGDGYKYARLATMLTKRFINANLFV